MRTKLRPLEPEEKAVAAENLWIVEAFLRTNRLPREDWWFREPRLYRYEFKTIAWKAMRSAAGHEREKQQRRLQTISLEELIPGSECMTWGDTITYDNLNYT